MMWGDSRSELTYEHISDFETPILSTRQSPLPGDMLLTALALIEFPSGLCVSGGVSGSA